MPCYSPLNGYKARHLNKSGKRGIVFNTNDGYADMPVQLPCGQCVGCRLERSRQWALRCVHENSLHKESQFITLTYNQENLPHHGGLVKSHFQNFLKRYRQYLVRNEGGKKIRYYMCGEYGDENLRPHYHSLIFGHNFSDKKHFRKTDTGHNLYTSTILDDLWTHGYCNIGEVNFESAAYVARYVMKKQNGRYQENAKNMFGLSPYHRVDILTGEYFEVIEEYTTMSRRPGIGKHWYEKYGSETYRDDYIIERGIKMQPPKYYDEQYQDIDIIKQKRRRKAARRNKDNTPERLAVKQKVKQSQLRFLKRSLQEY